MISARGIFYIFLFFRNILPNQNFYIRDIPLKNTPPYAQPANDKGGYSYMLGSDPKIFRLRRAKNRVFDVFEAKNFPPAAGQKSCVVCF